MNLREHLIYSALHVLIASAICCVWLIAGKPHVAAAIAAVYAFTVASTYPAMIRELHQERSAAECRLHEATAQILRNAREATEAVRQTVSRDKHPREFH